MNFWIRSAIVVSGAVSVFGLASCASMDDRSVAATTQTRSMTSNEIYMTRVDRVAKRRGIVVVWVHPPNTPQKARLATR